MGDKLLMFGKSHNTIGSIDSDLILQTKGNIKVRWHNRKFIDLLKNGKLNVEGSLVLHKVASLSDIKEDGIYLISDTGEVLLSIDGQIINLSSLGDSSYISFLIPLDITSDLKYQALTNAGFYYDTLESAQSANIQLGLVYIVSELKLYLAENGLLTEFFVNSPAEGEEVIQTFDELWIGDQLHIYNDDSSIIDAVNKLILSVGGDAYITLENNQVKVSKDLIIGKENIILSEGATADKGFRLYYKNGKSVLEVDDIIWRNKPEDTKCSRILDESITFSEHDNIILKAESANTTNNDGNITATGSEVICTLKYKHKYLNDQFIYIYTLNEGVIYTIRCEWRSGDENMSISIDSPYPEDIELEVAFEDNSTRTITIPANTINLEVSNDKFIKNWKVIKGPETWSDGETITAPAISKAIPKEFKIKAVTPDTITVELTDLKERENFIKSAFNSITAVSRKPYIRILDNNLTLLDRSKIVEKKPDETVHSKIGIIEKMENWDFPFDFPEDLEAVLTDCPEGEITWTSKETEKPVIDVGIYSDNFKGKNSELLESQILKGKILKSKILEGEIVNSTAVNERSYAPTIYSPIIYNAILRQGCKFPTYDGEEVAKDSNDHTIVYSAWVKVWIDELIAMIEALEAKVDLNKTDSDSSNSSLSTDIANILQSISDILTDLENNYVKKSELGELIKDYIIPKYGDANNPVVLISGTIFRTGIDKITFLFLGSKKDKITHITPLTKDGLMTVTIENEGTLTITSISVELNKANMTQDLTKTSVKDRGVGSHWFESRADNNKIYIREFHLGDGNNDTFVSDTWTHDNAPLAINITVFGYITI